MIRFSPAQEALIEAFRDASLAHEKWTHIAHLWVATWYLQSFSKEEALERLRRDIQNLNLFHGVYTTKERGYHETRTRVWLAVLKKALLNVSEDCAVEEFVEPFTRRDVAKDFFSRELLESWQARIDWVEPDISEVPLDPGSWCDTTPHLFTIKEN